MVTINIFWKKKKSNKEEVTFIEDIDIDSALYNFLSIKGGKDKIDIIKYRTWDRSIMKAADETVYSTDKDGAIYKIYHEE